MRFTGCCECAIDGNGCSGRETDGGRFSDDVDCGSCGGKVIAMRYVGSNEINRDCVVVELMVLAVKLRLMTMDAEVILMVAVVETRLKVAILKMRLMVVALKVR